MSGFERLRRPWHRLKDGWFTLDLADKVTIGTGDTWTVCRRSLRPESGMVLSAGVGHDMSFELALAQEYGMTVLLFDPSPVGIATAARPENQDPRVRFHPVGWAGRSAAVPFALPDERDGSSYSLPRRGEPTGQGPCSFPCQRVSDIAAAAGIARCPLLKMDIEGFEYEVLDDLLASSLQVDQICLEFHHFLKGVPLWRTWRALWHLRRAGYVAFHKRYCDYSFVRRDLLDNK